MRDLSEQLATYIDAIAEPVTRQEIATMKPEPQRPRRAMAAVLAGAAVVLIPAFVLVALGWIPSGGDVAAPATSLPEVTVGVSPATTPSVTEPPIADPLDSIAVPDLVGLVFADAEALLRELGLEIETSGDVTADGVVTYQEPVPGDSLSEGDSVLVMVGPAWSCADGPPPVEDLVSDETVEVTLLFQCGGGSEVPEISYAVIRHVSSDLEPVRAVLDQLLAGPTSDERVAGLGSFFTAETATALDSVTVDAGLAIVDFNENIYVNNASTSTGSLFFLAELNANLFQFEDIEQIEYRVDGRCETFWNWLQRECFVVTRQGESTASPFGTCSATGMQPPPPPSQELPEVVADMRALLGSLAARCDLAALDDLADLHGTNLTWSHLSFGDRPFWNAENGVIDGSTGLPAASLVAALALEFDTFVDDADTEVFVWPAVAAPGFRWDNLSNEEIAALTAQFGDAVISFSIEQGVWTSFSVEIDAIGGWRSFSQPLT